MAVPYWPESLPQMPERDMSDGIEDVRQTFQPDIGSGISRPKATAARRFLSLEFILASNQIADFTSFYEDTLTQGTKRFIWRDPIDGLPYWWRFPVGQGEAFKRRFMLKTLASISLRLARETASVWFASYIPDNVSRAPYFVADYDNAVYGIDGETVPASDLPSIAGTYWVERYTTTGITQAEETLVAGDIPASAPAGTTKIVGFDT